MSNANNKSATYAVKPAERDGQMLHIGQQCFEKSCMTIDFLPFRCQYCKESFCSEHFRPDGHKCEKYDAGMVDRIAPDCPICKTPVAIPPNEDPNIRMDRHLTQECSVLTGKTKTSSVPTCARPRCGKKLWAPISCDKCHQQFCSEHRYTDSHTCPAMTASGSGGPTHSSGANVNAKGPGQNLLSSLPARSAAASTAASAALKRFQNSASGAIASASSSASTASSSSGTGKSSGLFTNMKRDRDPISTSLTSVVNATSPATVTKSTSPVAGVDDKFATNKPTTTTTATTSPTNATVSLPPIPANLNRCGDSVLSPLTSRFLNASAFVPRPVFGTA